MVTEDLEPEAEALEYAKQIAKGLDHALTKKILHRDVKPDNLVVTLAPAAQARLERELESGDFERRAVVLGSLLRITGRYLRISEERVRIRVVRMLLDVTESLAL